MDAATISKQVVAARFALGMTQQELASRVGCSHGTLRFFERHGIVPAPRLVRRFARVLALDPAFVEELLATWAAERPPNRKLKHPEAAAE